MMRSRDISLVAGLCGLGALASPVLAQGVQEKIAAAKQAAMGGGKITITPGASTTGLRIADYEKAGD
jgi:hypothetical protein